MYNRLNKKTTNQIDMGFMKTLISIASQKKGQDWFSSDVGVDVWRLTLDTMCSDHHKQASSDEQANEEFENEINSLFIDLIKKILFLNRLNANLFAQYITKLIRDQKTLNGYLHQIILQIFLDDQYLKVNFERGPLSTSNKKCELFKPVCNSSLLLHLPHPQYATGSNYRLLEIQLNKKVSEVLTILTDTPMMLSNDTDDLNDALIGLCLNPYRLFSRAFVCSSLSLF
jgi:hypothetical protein